MIKEEKQITEQIVRHRFCDVCGKEIYKGCLVHCYMCRKDLCFECIEHVEHDCGDHENSYCKSCWNIGEKYRIEIDKHREEIDKLQNAWDNECNKIT